MSDENSPGEETRGGRDDSRLERIEQSVAQISARLAAIERQLAATRDATPSAAAAQPFGQGAPRPASRADSEPRAREADGAQTAEGVGEKSARDVVPLPPPPPHAWQEDREESRADYGADSHAEDRAENRAGTHAENRAGTHGENRAGRAAEESRPPASGVAPDSRPGAASDLRPGAASESRAGAAGWWLGDAEGDESGRRESASQAAPQAAPAPTRARKDLETLIGGSWFNWLGIIAVTLGVAFFLKYAFDNQWIGPRARVLLGGAAGAALLALAERLRAKGYRPYAYVLSGGGILILYLSAYAARVFYELLGVGPAFVLMAAVTATAVLLSVRYDALTIAVLGLLGGFATPVLLSTGVDNQLGLFGYVALLDAGVLALAYFKRWRVLNHLAFALTVLMFGAWLNVWYEPWKLRPTVFFLTLFFVMFSALAVVHNVLKGRSARWFDISLIITNATLYFGASYALLDEAGYQSALGTFALLVSLFFVGLYYATFVRLRDDQLLSLAYVGAAVTFFTMAVAIQLDQHWVTTGWAVEGLMLTWLGLRSDTAAPRYAALPVFAVALTHWFSTDMVEFAYSYDAHAAFVPLLNRRAFSCAMLVGALGGAVWLYRRRGEGVDKDEREILPVVFTLAANFMAVTLLTLDTFDYFQRAKGGVAPGDARSALIGAQFFAVTVLWAFYATAMLAVGVLRRLFALRVAALVLLGLCVIALLPLDALYYGAAWHTLFANATFLSFALTAAALVVCARLYAGAGERVGAVERAGAAHTFFAAANLLALVALSLEVLGYFGRSKSLVGGGAEPAFDQLRVLGNLENTKQMTLSFLWTTYGAAAFALGVARGRAYLRFGALIVLACAGVKILLLDSRFYAAAWHAPIVNQTFAAFALYVAALWYVAHLYARAGNVPEAERGPAITALTVVGNVFAVCALSLEASGYFRKQFAAREGRGWEEVRDLRLARQLSLSLVWAVYGGGMLFFGHLRRNRLLRLMALGLLGATTLKVFFFDLASLDRFYRIVSFIALGAILLAVSFLYQQRTARAAHAEED